jgi:hypothetical protein
VSSSVSQKPNLFIAMPSDLASPLDDSGGVAPADNTTRSKGSSLMSAPSMKLSMRSPVAGFSWTFEILLFLKTLTPYSFSALNRYSSNSFPNALVSMKNMVVFSPGTCSCAMTACFKAAMQQYDEQ